MVDFGRLLGFDWDDGNRRKSVEKPDVSQARAEQIFFDNSVLVSDDIRQSAGEPRFPALGRTKRGTPAACDVHAGERAGQKSV